MEVSKSSLIFVMWEDIQDIIGPARAWPYRIRRLHWTRNLNHFQSILVAKQQAIEHVYIVLGNNITTPKETE